MQEMNGLNMEKLMSRETILENVTYRMANKEKNAKKYKGCVRVDILDLVAVCRVNLMFDGNYSADVIVTEAMCEACGISAEELAEAAEHNTRTHGFTVTNIGSVLSELLGHMPNEEKAETPDYGALPMYVVTNVERMLGANALMYPELFQNLAERYGGDLYVIPSSTHEVLALPTTHTPLADILTMVADINANVVEEKDVLSDSVYLYSRATGSLCLSSVDSM